MANSHREKLLLSHWKPLRTVLLLCATANGLSSQTLTALASFNGANGYRPASPLVQGTDGNFYGTTNLGGANYPLNLVGGGGTVFKISPSGTVTTLYSFCSEAGCPDGANPKGGLVQASDGNFYGTTTVGGANHSLPSDNGGGTAFKITPGGALTTLYSFCSHGYPCVDGYQPTAGLVHASDGNFYGTTSGDNTNYGTVFKLTPGGTLTTLYSFCSKGLPCVDGAEPYAGLIQASDGNFYGTTSALPGTVFSITPEGTLTTLYSFCSEPNCPDGDAPSGVIQASDGNFYGTTEFGGANPNAPNGGGTAFRVTPAGILTTLHSFCSLAKCADGEGPTGLFQASNGNLYGTTASDGANDGGTIFAITSGGTLTTLYSFCSQAGCADGENPAGGMIQSSDGNLYGATYFGGAENDGTIFELALASSTASPAINSSGGVVNGASFQAGIARGSWITIYGTNLSPKTDTWANAIVGGNLPTSLDGVKVSVGGDPAYIYYISPTQIDAVAPNVAAGSVPVMVTNSSGTSSPVNGIVQAAQPAFFQWGNYAVATTQDYAPLAKNGTLSGVTTTPAKPGEIVILWGTGFGPTSPAAPEGVEVPSGTTYNTANTVTVTVGGMAATVYGAALAPGDTGLYQVAIQVPATLADGDYAAIATVLGAQSPSTTMITLQN